MQKRLLTMVLVFLSAAPGWTEDPYDLATSTPTQAPKKQLSEHRPRKAPMKQLKEVERQFKRAIQKTSPNPRVQKPGQSPLPANAPDMPKGPQFPPQPTAGERFFAAVAKVMTKSWGPNIFVWLPAISTDPNTGPTYGILPVLVLADKESRHIRHLLAPSYTHNSLFGQTGTMRYYWYPTDNSQLFALGSFSEKTNREAKIRYENPSLMDGILYLRTEAYYDVTGSNRFFGFGPYTRESDESGYTSKDSVGRFQIGLNFFRSWRATFGQRFRQMSTRPNIIPDTVDLAVRYPGIAGIGTENTYASELRILWDSRDLPVTPSRGSSGELFFEKTNNALGSDASFIRYGLEGKRFFAWNNPKHLTVIRGLYEWANGEHIPFYELPSIGGRETLRGYGKGRLADRGRFVANIEHRITMASLALMGIETNFEIAPFFDIGSVFPTLPEIQRKNFRPVFGGAFRAAVKPNVVGDVEVGVGKEGVAVFVDISYPF